MRSIFDAETAETNAKIAKKKDPLGARGRYGFGTTGLRSRRECSLIFDGFANIHEHQAAAPVAD